ncbi:MAG: formate dehydrogenase [Rhodospirillaceae bacterium]|nr:formate dehydrogenase [Rhodospirillaceae bacterium]|tara:strand:- start:183 stop:389 length:207 start_codon:yes stop_codon:yes gene_type:complete
MEPQRLTAMANQIAAFFDAYPEDEAVTATADHLRQFWDPRMRGQLKEILAAGGEIDLTPTALAAARRI